MHELRAKRSRDEEAEGAEAPAPFPLTFFPPGMRFFDFQGPSSSDSEDDSEDGGGAWGQTPFDLTAADLASLPLHDVFARALASGPPPPLPFMFPPFSFARMLSSTLASFPATLPAQSPSGTAGRGRAARSTASAGSAQPPASERASRAGAAGKGKGSKGGGRGGRTRDRGGAR